MQIGCVATPPQPDARQGPPWMEAPSGPYLHARAEQLPGRQRKLAPHQYLHARRSLH